MQGLCLTKAQDNQTNQKKPLAIFYISWKDDNYQVSKCDYRGYGGH